MNKTIDLQSTPLGNFMGQSIPNGKIKCSVQEYNNIILYDIVVLYSTKFIALK